MEKRTQLHVWYVIAAVMGLLLIQNWWHAARTTEIIPYSDFQTFLDQRIAGTFVWYPQPLGFQAEWQAGTGPGLNDAQTEIQGRSLQGGYVMTMYKLDTEGCGIFIPYFRYQHYRGGYRSIANAPYGNHDQWDIGVEWQIFKEMELVTEYSFVDGINLNAINQEGATSYQNANFGALRFQFQMNY